jgi:hypothetical protein
LTSLWQGRDDPQAKRKRLEDLLEALAVVKWGYCGPLEERSLCDAFNVNSQFGFGWEDEADDADTANAGGGGGGHGGDKEGPQTYLALDNETPLAISEKLGLDLPTLLEFNVPIYGEGLKKRSKLKAGTVIYLEKHDEEPPPPPPPQQEDDKTAAVDSMQAAASSAQGLGQTGAIEPWGGGGGVGIKMEPEVKYEQKDGPASVASAAAAAGLRPHAGPSLALPPPPPAPAPAADSGEAATTSAQEAAAAHWFKKADGSWVQQGMYDALLPNGYGGSLLSSLELTQPPTAATLLDVMFDCLVYLCRGGDRGAGAGGAGRPARGGGAAAVGLGGGCRGEPGRPGGRGGGGGGGGGQARGGSELDLEVRQLQLRREQRHGHALRDLHGAEGQRRRGRPVG